MNIVKRNFKSFLLFIVSAFLFFWVGVRYEQLERHKQEVLMFANITGDEIITINKLINSFDNKTKDEIVSDYNISTLNDIGCSTWLIYLSDFEDEHKELFFTGIDIAIEAIELPKDNQCINNLLKIR